MALLTLKDIEPTPLPTTLNKGGSEYSGKDVPEAFSKFLNRRYPIWKKILQHAMRSTMGTSSSTQWR